jgi:hypothetical protein
LPANRAPRCICCTALSFFAGKPGSYRRTWRRGVSVLPRYRSSPASLAPTGEHGAAVYLFYRVSVLRRQAWLLHTKKCTPQGLVNLVVCIVRRTPPLAKTQPVRNVLANGDTACVLLAGFNTGRLRWRGDLHGRYQQEQHQQANVIGKKTFCFHCQYSRDR